MTEDDFTARLRDYFAAHGHDTGLDDAGFAEAAELVQTRIVVLGDAWGLLKFLDDDSYELDPKAAAKELGPDAVPVLDAAVAALESVSDWTTPSIEAALKTEPDRRIWSSSRARRSARSGSPSPVRRSARRCSSRWSCWAASAAWRGCAAPREPRAECRGREKAAPKSLVVCSSAQTDAHRHATIRAVTAEKASDQRL